MNTNHTLYCAATICLILANIQKKFQLLSSAKLSPECLLLEIEFIFKSLALYEKISEKQILMMKLGDRLINGRRDQSARDVICVHSRMTQMMAQWSRNIQTNFMSNWRRLRLYCIRSDSNQTQLAIQSVNSKVTKKLS